MFIFFWVAGDGDCGYRALACAILEGAARNRQAACFLLTRMAQLHEELPSWVRTTQSAQGLHIFQVCLSQVYSTLCLACAITHVHSFSSSVFYSDRVLIADAEGSPIIPEIVLAAHVQVCISTESTQTCRAEDLQHLLWKCLSRFACGLYM